MNDVVSGRFQQVAEGSLDSVIGMTRPVGSPAACRQARGAVQGIVASRADLLGFRRMKPLPDAFAVQGVEKGRWLVAPVERPPGRMFDRREPCAGDVAGVRGERHGATDAERMPLRPVRRSIARMPA